MRVDKSILAKGFSIQQAFFLGCWFNMSHELSLDSDRPSFINPIRGIKELLSLYDMGNDFGAAGKRVLVGVEIADTLKNDRVVKANEYSAIVERLVSLLDEENNNTKPEQCKVNTKHDLIISLSLELLKTLEERYLLDSFNLLKIELDNFNEAKKDEHFEAIIELTNSVMGALSDKGAGLQETNAFYRFILMKNGTESFDQRFEHLITAAMSPPEEYELTFELRCNALVDIIETGNSINFGPLKIAPIDSKSLEAKCILKAQSYTIAGAQAYDLLGEFVDALSYTLGKQEITIVTSYTAKLINRNKTKSFKIHRPIPNPNYQFEKEKFSKFCESIESSNGNQNRGIKDNKISAAFRLLRVGSQATNTESKFTSYWTALESLTRDVFNGYDGDDSKVIAATIPCIAVDYITKKLRSFINALHQVGTLDFTYPDGQPFSLRNSKPSDLYELLLDSNKANIVKSSLSSHPYFQYKFDIFTKYFTSSIDMLDSILKHEKKVDKHLRRIYRVRNLIVHDARNIEGLEQLCAHLEHYLKGCLNAMLEFMTVKPTIHTPKEFFIRYADLVQEMKKELDPSFLIRNEVEKSKKKKSLIEKGHNNHSKMRALIELHQ